MFLKDGGDVSQRWGPRLFRSSDGVLYVSADGGGVLNCYADGGYGSSFTQLKDVFQGSAFVRSYVVRFSIHFVRRPFGTSVKDGTWARASPLLFLFPG